MENCNASQILKEAIRTVVRHEMKKTSSKTDDREKNFINLEEELIFENRLVEIGLDLFLPTMAIQVAAGIGEFNQRSQELLETDFLNQSFHKIIQNKSDTRSISLGRIRDFCATQNASPKQIFDFNYLGGDPHNKGQEPMAFSIQYANSGKRTFVYKPVCGASQQIFNYLYELVLSRLDYSTVHLPKILSLGDGTYCIKEYVEASQLLNGSKCSQYFFLFGVLIACALALRATDLHFENVINANGIPIPIDAEFILPPKYCKLRGLSIEETGLLGSALSAANGIADYSMIGFNIESYRNGPLLRYAKSERRTGHLVTSISGEVNDAKNFRTKITSGVLAARHIIKSNKFEILDGCNQLLAVSDARFRILLRNTSLYRILQLKLWTPVPLKVTERLDFLRKLLKKHQSIHITKGKIQALEQLIDKELIDLQLGDIPYFWIAHNSKELHHHHGCIQADFVKNSFQQRLSSSLLRFISPNQKTAILAELDKHLN